MREDMFGLAVTAPALSGYLCAACKASRRAGGESVCIQTRRG